jgi:RNA polymerase sigma factor, sigma-70 family
MSEAELIRLAQKKDKQAFAELFRIHYAFLFHYLLKLTMSREMAEDTLQDAMLKAYLHIQDYNGSSSFSTWLITIAGHTYLDRLRKDKREQAWLTDRRLMLNRQLAWQLQEKGEQWSDLLEKFSRLRPDIRMAVVLKHYYGYSYDEIAEMTGVRSGTIKSRVHTGITELRKGDDQDEGHA